MPKTHRRPGPAETPEKEYRCKHCHVQVMGRYDVHPVLGKQHKKSCPRARNMN